jgi:hypothetical protein
MAETVSPPEEETAAIDPQRPFAPSDRMSRIDVERPQRIAAVDVAVGRITLIAPRTQGGPLSAPEQSFGPHQTSAEPMSQELR